MLCGAGFSTVEGAKDAKNLLNTKLFYSPPTNVFELVDGKSKATRVADCIECCACVDACPTKAIKHSSC